jgi:hypothetical protein
MSHSDTANCACAAIATRQYVPSMGFFAQFYGYQSHNKPIGEKGGGRRYITPVFRPPIST